MEFSELFILAIALSMDAFAFAVVSGLGMRRFSLSGALVVGLYFGIAQAVMPIIGFFIGTGFAEKIGAVDHWVVFGLLAAIGIKMVVESLRDIYEGKRAPANATAATPCKDDVRPETSLAFAALFPLAIADSLDALAVGASFALMGVGIFFAAAFIGVVTLLISMGGVKIGNVFGLRFKAPAEMAGGIVLVLLGVRVLAEHLAG